MKLPGKYLILIYCALIFSSQGFAQGLGQPVIYQTFDEGVINPGPALAPGKTGFDFTTDSCPPLSKYTVTNSLYRCPSTRMGRSVDNTPNSRNGYMMLINPPGDKEILVFADTIRKSLCPGTAYRFSANFLNVGIPAQCSNTAIVPKFILTVEKPDGTVIASTSTGPLGYAYDTIFTPKFRLFTVSFVMPAGLSGLVVRIRSIEYGFVPCEIPVAIDDILLAAEGPVAEIKFADALGQEVVRQVCYHDNKSVTFAGNVDSFYSNTLLQWQKSTDDGRSWQDIPGAGSKTYSANFPVADTFLYRLSAAEAKNIGNADCRVVSNTLKVEVNGEPNNLVVRSNSPVCVGQDVQFNAETDGVIYYEWFGPNGFHDDVYYPSVNRTQLRDSGMYYVEITTVGGCKFRDSTWVQVFGVGAVTAGNDTSICLGSTVQLHGTRAQKIRWSPAQTLSDSTVADPVATPVKTTTYLLSVSDNSKCISTDTVRVTVVNSIVVKASFIAPEYICTPTDTVTFINTSQGNLNQWFWNFGNAQGSTEQQPAVVQYNSSNENFYDVLLAVSDSAGCRDTAHRRLTVAGSCYIAVPNAFTPNGDGKNDYLYPLNAFKAKDLLFRVYNRYGQLVFETRNWQQKWDGRINGHLPETSVYVWILEYTESSQRRVTLKGTVTLIR